MAGWKNKKSKPSKKREMNPTDAYRKQQRNKEKKRNKQERKQIRETAHLIKNPHLIKEELDKLNHQALLAQLDETGDKRRGKLESMYEIVKQKAKSEQNTRDAQLNGWQNSYNYLPIKKNLEDSDSNEDDSDSIEDNDSEIEQESTHSNDEEFSLSSAPPLPPGPPPPGLPPSTHTMTYEAPQTIPPPIPIDFTHVVNPERPILPPPPPPLPTSQPPVGKNYELSRNPMFASQIPYPTMSYPVNPIHAHIYSNQPSIPLNTHSMDTTHIRPAPTHTQPISHINQTTHTSTTPHTHTPQILTPPHTHKPSSTTSTHTKPASFFVPTQLRVSNKTISKPKDISQKVSSISQVTAYSTGAHRTHTHTHKDITNITTAKEFISNTTSKKRAEIDTQSQIDKAFNDFLKQVEKT